MNKTCSLRSAPSESLRAKTGRRVAGLTLRGKTTYLTCATVLVLAFGAWQHWWKIPPEVCAVLGTLALAFLRAGVNREVGDLEVSASGPTRGPRSKTQRPKSPGLIEQRRRQGAKGPHARQARPL
jgi:hypothetical protein